MMSTKLKKSRFVRLKKLLFTENAADLFFYVKLNDCTVLQLSPLMMKFLFMSGITLHVTYRTFLLKCMHTRESAFHADYLKPGGSSCQLEYNIDCTNFLLLT